MSEHRRIVVLYAHPYPRHSRAGRALLAGVDDLPFVTVRSLYDLYPDFAIDVEAEQKALADADAVVWQTPFYWYGVPSLLHHWFEKVLTEDWAYGDEARGLCGKRALWVTTTGTAKSDYTATGMHGHNFSAFVPAVEQTARFCGMKWQQPMVIHGVNSMNHGDLAEHATAYRSLLTALAKAPEVQSD